MARMFFQASEAETMGGWGSKDWWSERAMSKEVVKRSIGGIIYA
jgi:hypothetical protein